MPIADEEELMVNEEMATQSLMEAFHDPIFHSNDEPI